jgi:hypothetical protein
VVPDDSIRSIPLRNGAEFGIQAYMRLFVAMSIVSLLCSCGRHEPVACPGSISPGSRTGTEAAAISDALVRSKGRCGPNARNCHVIASESNDGQILVGIHFLVPNDSSGTCAQRIGDEIIFVYTRDGHYRETIPGM